MINYYCDNCNFLEDRSKDNCIDGYCEKYNQFLNFYDWFEKCNMCLIETLHSENVQLRARLDRAVELPCNACDTILALQSENAELRARLERAIEFPRIRKASNHAQTGKYVVEYINSEDGGVDLDIDLTKEQAKARIADLRREK